MVDLMSQHWIYLLAAVVVIIVAVVLILRGEHGQREVGLPTGRVVYSDTSGWMKASKPLFDAEWGLAGKPDYLVNTSTGVVPVEVKSTAANEPYPGHMMQLAAYCRLVHVQTGIRPELGYLRYRNATFEIQYTQEMEENLKRLVEEIRCAPISSKTPRSHDQLTRCRACGYHDICPERLQ